MQVYHGKNSSFVRIFASLKRKYSSFVRNHGKNSSFVRIFASLKRKYSSFVRKNKSLVRFLNIRYLLSLYMHAEIDIL